jgi:hypothetical protein
VKAGQPYNAALTREPARLQGISAPDRAHRYCLPCRRSRVRIPSAASERPAFAGLFLRAQSACASASGRTGSGLAAGRSSAVPRKTPCLQVDSGSPNRSPSAGLQKVRCSALLGPVIRLLLQRHNPVDSARRRDTSGRGPWGPNPVSVQKPRGQSALLRDPASHGPQSRELLRRTASEAAARAHHRWLVPRQSHGVITEGVAFHRQAGVCSQLGWAAGCRPQQEPSESRREC